MLWWWKTMLTYERRWYFWDAVKFSALDPFDTSTICCVSWDYIWINHSVIFADAFLHRKILVSIYLTKCDSYIFPYTFYCISANHNTKNNITIQIIAEILRKYTVRVFLWGTNLLWEGQYLNAKLSAWWNCFNNSFSCTDLPWFPELSGSSSYIHVTTFFFYTRAVQI